MCGIDVKIQKDTASTAYGADYAFYRQHERKKCHTSAVSQGIVLSS
ncbi:hypothetical protein RUMCAL_00663 [Ruminococcus callidus ATCC 27760]|uniref:Uncharacterized protein n=1 Tax=Ruminococcus callidus ATCC 27760 TaxID=411473 RepID=U2KXX3_9FIRM|nr:hypothetical protein RUMCAL_00663 [Ruminococcus callidus ATCC 27760]